MAENRLAGQVALVAQDADLAACQRIVEGTQTMTVYKPIEQEASTAAILAVALGNGTDITSKDCEIPGNRNNRRWFRRDPILQDHTDRSDGRKHG